MHIYFAGTAGFDPSRALAPGRRPAAESAAAWSLLAWALRRDFGLGGLPAAALDGGKPYFPARPDICFSLSHTRGYVLCAIAGTGVGADVQFVSPKDAPFAARLMSERERADFTLHELWCLREAAYKLTGRGSLRDTPLHAGGRSHSPALRGVECRLYGGIPGCAAPRRRCAGGAFPAGPEGRHARAAAGLKGVVISARF